MLMGTEWSQSQASLRTPWRFWKTQFCPGSILSKQIFSLSVPALRISYATESFLEQSSGMHWYGTACQHPDARTVSCWPVLKSKWGEKKNQSLIMEQWCLTLWLDQFFLFICVSDGDRPWCLSRWYMHKHTYTYVCPSTTPDGGSWVSISYRHSAGWFLAGLSALYSHSP